MACPRNIKICFLFNKIVFSSLKLFSYLYNLLMPSKGDLTWKKVEFGLSASWGVIRHTVDAAYVIVLIVVVLAARPTFFFLGKNSRAALVGCSLLTHVTLEGRVNCSSDDLWILDPVSHLPCSLWWQSICSIWSESSSFDVLSKGLV